VRKYVHGFVENHPPKEWRIILKTHNYKAATERHRARFDGIDTIAVAAMLVGGIVTISKVRYRATGIIQDYTGPSEIRRQNV